jgi:sugar lactone lactonase YvrE
MPKRQVSLFATGFKFPEGPVFDRKGDLFAVDVETGNISKVDEGSQRG